MRRLSPVAKQLIQNPFAPGAVVLNFNFPNRRVQRMLFYRHRHVLPSPVQLEDTVAVDPTALDVLSRIKNNPAIGLRNQRKMAQIREKIWLHEPKAHISTITE